MIILSFLLLYVWVLGCFFFVILVLLWVFFFFFTVQKKRWHCKILIWKDLTQTAPFFTKWPEILWWMLTNEQYIVTLSVHVIMDSFSTLISQEKTPKAQSVRPITYPILCSPGSLQRQLLWKQGLSWCVSFAPVPQCLNLIISKYHVTH